MNDKKKNPFEGIFALVTDDNLLRENGLLYAENKQLQSNWNSLREWLIETKNCFFTTIDVQVLLDKMNELESDKDV